MQENHLGLLYLRYCLAPEQMNPCVKASLLVRSKAGGSGYAIDSHRTVSFSTAFLRIRGAIG